MAYHGLAHVQSNTFVSISAIEQSCSTCMSCSSTGVTLSNAGAKAGLLCVAITGQAIAMRVPLARLREVTKAAIEKNGYHGEEADVLLEILLFAQSVSFHMIVH